MKPTLALCLLICLFSCSRTNTTIPSELTGDWILNSVTETNTGQTISRPAGIVKDVLIRFHPDNLLTGFTQVNEILPTDYTTSGGNRLSIPAISHTKVNETAWGSFLLDNASHITTYRLTGNQLQLISPGIVLNFSR